MVFFLRQATRHMPVVPNVHASAAPDINGDGGK